MRRVSTASADSPHCKAMEIDDSTQGDYFCHQGDESPLLQQDGFYLKPESSLHRWYMKWRIAIFGLRPSYKLRLVHLRGATRPRYFVPNVVCNQKYSIFTFLPVVLFQQFRFFFNLFYLVVALSQFIPALSTGPIFTYLAPLSFVLFVTITKEAYDDYKRYQRDREANSQKFEVLTPSGIKSVSASQIEVGSIVQLHANERVPCDLVFLRTSDKSGTTFIRTDQLDGETDWKLRRAMSVTQSLRSPKDILSLDGVVTAEAPRRDIYDFVGKFIVKENHQSWAQRLSRTTTRAGVSNDSVGSFVLTTESEGTRSTRQMVSVEGTEFSNTAEQRYVEALGLENTLWANTVVTAGTIQAVAVYTGKETRAAMNTSRTSSKVGLFDLEVNFLSKILFAMLVVMAFVLLVFKGFHGHWGLYFLRFILLLSSIIPISLRVNLDMAKTFYSYMIMRDDRIPQTVVRTSTIPEELGRIDYLLSDKTGTLTQNEMIFKQLHIGKAQFTDDDMEEMRMLLIQGFDSSYVQSSTSQYMEEEMISSAAIPPSPPSSSIPLSPLKISKQTLKHSKRRLEIRSILKEFIMAVGLCHNVTPVREEDSSEITFQAASPDEVALVGFAAKLGVKLLERDEQHIVLHVPPHDEMLTFEILACFPFSSETKRMGLIVRDSAGRLHFFLKGAEVVMMERLQPRGCHWLLEECSTFARKGLRTLVFGHRELTEDEYARFNRRYADARSSMNNRVNKMRREIDSLEVNLELLGLTGVEDRLQIEVPQTLEALRHAGVKVWMLTGDKVETATCIAISAGLKARQHNIFPLTAQEVTSATQAQEALERFAMGPTENILVVDGSVLGLCLDHPVLQREFIEIACQAPAVVCCRCSPTQKASVVRRIKEVTRRRTCAIGDGGNDVSMIQAADCGVGIVGREGRQASLAADFSVSHFHYLRRLLLWHGRNSYQRSSKLAQFVIHRGMIIAVIQMIFSAIFFFIPLAIFQGWLTVGYATYYTMWPVFSLVLDVELPEPVVYMFPELYQTLKSGRVMSIKTFFGWVWKSIYQGAVIMMSAIILFEDRFLNIVSIAFTSLVLSELLNVASEITTWHPLMIVAEILTIVVYLFSMCILRSYFDISFIVTTTFWWKVFIITVLSWVPVHVFKVIQKVVKPPQYTKLAV